MKPIGSSRPLRGAVLGCGHISPFHLRAWARIEGVEIVALANRTLEKAQARAREFGVPLEHVYSDYRELVERERLDFVDIATAPHIHREQAESAARHGLPVLCQKPLAPSLEDARAMAAACAAAGVLLSVNENWRWRSWYRELKRLMLEGTIGRPRYARIARHRNETLPRPDGSLPELFVEQPYTLELDRLILFEWGIHLIDVLRFLFGEVRSVFARVDKVSPLVRGEDRAVVVLDLCGVTGVLDLSWATLDGEAAHSRLEHVTIEGDDGTLELLPGEEDLLQVRTRAGVGCGHPCVVRRPTSTRPATQPAAATLRLPA